MASNTKLKVHQSPLGQLKKELKRELSDELRGGLLTAEAIELVDESAQPVRAVNAEYHSQLAMKAAKKMRRTKQKLRTGQEVCHHLRMMLSSEPNRALTSDAPLTASNENQFLLGF